ncbi:Nitrogen regulation protein NR(I) [compost metagenome]
MEQPSDTTLKQHRAKVLVAEDEEDLRLTICDWLSMRGYAVQGAQDGLEALEIASRQTFDVVVTDLKMPRCDGLHLLTALKARDPLVQVIFLTGQASMNDAIEALRHGRSFDFLQKPLNDLRLLEQVIERALAHRAQQADLPPDSEAASLPTQALPPGVSEEPALVMAFNFLEAHFREPIGLREVAAATEYSPAYLTNLMRLKTGKTTQQWILHYKMTEAQRLLSTTDWSIQRIATTLGYADANYFHRQFRQALGSSPQNWRLAGASSDRA